MAKDGTNRGGARLGSGQKKKPIADKILDGNPGHRKLTVMDFTDTADLTAEAMPEPNAYLTAKQKDGTTTLAAVVFQNTWILRLMIGALFAERRVFIMKTHSNMNAEDG